MLLVLISSASIETTQNERERQLRALVEGALSHYQSYFESRKAIAGEDVLVMFSAPWLSSFERTYLWVAGFKPTLIFRLAESGVDDLSSEQGMSLKRLKAETVRSEREVMEAMATVQESVAAPPILTLVPRLGRALDGEVSALDEAMESLKAPMLGVLESPDALRGSTMRKIMEVLTPIQTLKFLVAAAQFQLWIRRWGLQRDSPRETIGTSYSEGGALLINKLINASLKSTWERETIKVKPYFL